MMGDMEILEQMDGPYGLFYLKPDIFDAAVLDLPYPFDRTGGTTARCQNWFPAFNGWKGENWEDAYDDPTLEENDQEAFWRWFHVLMHEVIRTCRDGSYIILFTTEENMERIKKEIKRTPSDTHHLYETEYRRAWVWDKKNFGMGYYGRVQHEFMMVFTLGTPNTYVQSHGTIFRHKKVNSDFPTEKPVSLFKEMLPLIIDDDKDPDEVRICDATCGSGPVLKAAKDLGYGYCGFDIWDEAIEKTKEKLRQKTISGEDLSFDHEKSIPEQTQQDTLISTH